MVCHESKFKNSLLMLSDILQEWNFGLSVNDSFKNIWSILLIKLKFTLLIVTFAEQCVSYQNL